MGRAKLKLTPKEQVAVGGMATLTLATRTDGGWVVIRKMHPRLRWKLRMYFSFTRGTRIRELVSPHNHVVYSLERGWDGLMPYEVIEYVHGMNLHEMVSKKDPRLRDHMLEILRQAALSVAHIHTKGFIHLDIKADNFMFNDGADKLQVKITDFDLARSINSAKVAHRAGTASYMAPETLVSGAVGVGADIFAFGVMMYYLTTGRKPFSAFSAEEVRRQQVSDTFNIQEPGKINVELAPKLNKLIMQCLEKNPGKRPPSLAYLAQELSHV